MSLPKNHLLEMKMSRNALIKKKRGGEVIS
jgi:hypothetical protein